MVTDRRAIWQAAFILMSLPVVLSASPIIDFSDWTSPSGKATNLGTQETFGPITARAFKRDSVTGIWSSSILIARDETGDHGLGVCSEGLSDCSIGSTDGGDQNELSQLEESEAILLSLAVGWQWSEVWVSSLDGQGTGGSEEGRLHWGNAADIPSLLGEPSFSFGYPAFGGSKVEGNVLALMTPGLFDLDARHLLFVNDGVEGENNDYLVFGATPARASVQPVEPVPEPGTLLLMGAGWMAAAFGRCRRRWRA
jgi:hypothetical protein